MILKNYDNLRVFKNITSHKILIYFRLITVENSKTIFLKKFWKLKDIARINGVPYNPQHQGAIEALNRIVQNLVNSSKTTKRKDI